MGKRAAIGCILLLLAGTGLCAGEQVPDAAKQAYNAAWSTYRAGRGEESREALEALVDAYPSFRDPHVLLAVMLRDGGDPEAAAAVYRKLLEKRPADVDVRLWPSAPWVSGPRSSSP